MFGKFFGKVVLFPQEGARITAIFCTKKILFVQNFRKRAEVFSESSGRIDKVTLLSDKG